MLKILQTTNIDFGRSFIGKSVEGDRLRAGIKTSFTKIIDAALERSVDLVIFAGNTFYNNDLSQHTLSFFATEVKRLDKIQAVIMPGSNDGYDKSGFWDYLKINSPAENLHVFASSKVTSINIPSIKTTVYGIPQKAHENSGNERISFDKDEDTNYHIAVTFANENSDNENTINSSSPIFSGFDFIAVGGSENYKAMMGDGLKAACSGSPFVFSADNDSNKGVLIAEIENDTASVNFHPIDSFVWQKLEIPMDNLIDSAEIKNRVLGVALPNKLLKVKFTGLTLLDTGLNLDQLKDELEGNFLQLEFEDNTSVLPENVSAVKVHDKTMLGQYLKIMVEKLNSAELTDKTKLEESLKTGYSLLSGRAVW